LTPTPLAVDLDGTLILTDTLHESAVRALRARPLSVLQIPFWLAQGKAALKQRLSALTDFDAAALPYNEPLLEWLRAEHAQGRKLILCTAADTSMAHAVAEHTGIFDEVMASDGHHNLSAENKGAALEARFGRGGFDYAGNSSADLPVWRRSRRAIVVNASASVEQQARAVSEVERVFASNSVGLADISRVLRLHQWTKNLLLFITPMAAHIVPDAGMASALMLAFLAFCLCASAVYIANDLFDLDSDRHHPRKKFRPFASGRVSVHLGVLLIPLLLLLSALLGIQAGPNFTAWLAFYFLLTCAYSWGLKRLIIADCLVLAMLYSVRIIAGASAADIPMSFWLLAFSVFLFLSLAFVKRYAELIVQAQMGREKAHGRGYLTTDASLVQNLGMSAGYSAVLVLAFYLNSDAVMKLYRSPEFMWASVPIMLFWISWVWMKAHRGQMHDDPLIFAFRDKASLIAGVAFTVVLAIGSRGWQW
jgi:4-hydroxybenzoate polyprenyltransferase/phosphoserine phosphatase